MKVELVNQPGNTAAKITLAAGETCTAEAGAMIDQFIRDTIM